MTRLGTILKAVIAFSVIAVVAIGASAALDEPSRTSSTETVIEAPREEVWFLLMDFDSYPEWNPYMPVVEGHPALGRTLDVRLEPPGGDAREIEASVVVYKPPRKLRWQSRLLAPGLRDLEYEVIVAPLGPNRTQVVQRARYEGLLVMFADSGPTTAGLESMASALKRRAEASR